MKTNYQILYFTTLVLTLSSCISLHNGVFTSNASLEKGNFKIKGIATGRSSTFYVIGFGGLAHDGLMLNAKRDLYKEANLLDNQVLANISCDNTYTYLLGPLYIQHDIVLTGDIIEFTDKSTLTADTLVKPIKPSKIVKIDYGINVGNVVKYKDIWGFVYEGIVRKVDGKWFTIETPTGKEITIKVNDIITK